MSGAATPVLPPDARLRKPKRPLPRGTVSEAYALAFAFVLGAGSMLILALLVNALTAVLTFFSIIGYAIVYTVWLKRATPQNIVIGGAAGAFPPMIGWAAVTMLTLACGVRLARFNATIERKRHVWEQDYLTGVPAPAGAILALLPIYLDGLRSTGDPVLPAFAPQPLWISWTIIAYTVTVAFLMVSTIPTFAGKLTGDRIAREYPVVLLVLGVVALGQLLVYPYATLAAVSVLYLLLLPLGVRRYLQLEKPGPGPDGGDDGITATYSHKPGE